MPVLASIYISAHTADPTRDGSNEVSGNAYARQQVGSGGGDSTFSVSDARFTDNDSAIVWPAALGGNWGTITYIGAWDALTNGNFLWQVAVTTSRIINDGDILQINQGDLNSTAD